ncbi:MAG: helix-turn-helix transcriptional regulator [Cypionkella sp.]|jgi:AraC-like DNA-binding protein/quercetin dioxygenase-like cupin family protein
MTMHSRLPDAALNAQLADRLAPIAAQARTGFQAFGSQLMTYCCLERERIASFTPPHPMIGIVLSGSKEIWLGEQMQSFAKGQVFILPRGVSLDVVNILDERSGQYATLILEIRNLPEGVAPLTQPETEAPAQDFAMPLSQTLVDALCHAASFTESGPASAEVQTLRLREVLTLLRNLPAARPLFQQSLPERVGWLLRSDPAHGWSVTSVASHLGLGASTLRRKLDAAGTPFRSLLREVRMQAAQSALAAGSDSTNAALAAGYASRSHFARHYRAAFGTTPRGR